MMNGAITLNELKTMPLKSFYILRKACGIVQLDERINNLLDMRAAFGSDKQDTHINTLIKTMKTELKSRIFGKHNQSDSSGGTISWEDGDPDAADRLNTIMG